MDKENIFIQVVQNSKEVEKMEKKMVTENIFGQMAENTKVVLKMIKEMVWEFYPIARLDFITWGGGRMVKRVVMGFNVVLV